MRRIFLAGWILLMSSGSLFAGSMQALEQALARGESDVGDRLEHEFERALIRRALAHTGASRDDLAQMRWGNAVRIFPSRAFAAVMQDVGQGASI